MKILISGGGTGGHIYPAISIAHKIKEHNPDAELLYVGTDRGMESDIVPKEGIPFEAIRVRGFQRKLSMDTLKTGVELVKGLNDARTVIKKFKPDLVIGTGGYVCGPVVMTAALRGIPTLIHEQNAFPGVTNKILSKFVDKVACGFEEAEAHFKDKGSVVTTGNPVRQDILSYDSEEMRSKLGLGEGTKMILSFGGSGGQKSLNDGMYKYISDNLGNKGIRIVHVTGKRFYKSFTEKLAEDGMSDLPGHIEVMEYCYNLPEYMAAADLVVTSAGAITIAELTALGIPSIMIPKRNTAENHQEYNARALEKKGASRVILEKDLPSIDFTKEVNAVVDNKALLDKMKQNSRNMGIRDASDRIYRVVEGLLQQKR